MTESPLRNLQTLVSNQSSLSVIASLNFRANLHLADESIFVDRSALLTSRTSGCLRPHLFDVF